MSKDEFLKLFSHIDHTALSQIATEADIKKLCDEATSVHAASVCVPPAYVAYAKEYAGENIKICTVIGFPNGYSTTATKVFETEDAVQNGADEIDMVINIGKLKSGDLSYVLGEIEQVREACPGKILKVIVETAFLTDEEKATVSEMVTSASADYIKTSTGFAFKGAELSDIKILKSHIGRNVKIKAAGGIRNAEMAKKFIEAGADRIGSSSIIKEYLKK